MENSYSVLYAEDDENVRKNYVLYLEKYFDKIYEASDGLEALNLYKDKKPNILLLDITMPQLNGLEVIRKIREVDQTTPIIVLSAHSHKEYLFEAIKLNLVDYLIKPINRNEFKEVIESSFDRLKNNTVEHEDKVVINNKCYWDARSRILFFKDKIVDLTKNERILFELLLNKKNQIVKPVEISSYVWNTENNINDASIRNLVKRLRKKLPVDIIDSIYGSGYILNY
ncbi:response regulator transcription factor [Halarcobacter bivalviorum]|uniref:DNA-binding response regulator n=1 Tax=Halarcobacter bivalviorum TaxID=663364 RepID=A0AAX2AA24_9BACT|nr:response regulator [Halarcobacter bivalviorum]AXH12764.1 signal transduction response regulator [Halarcobacter bivalviorum]RXK08194.1 DNA-binding response regulator [Halarcobacter bivalviorum]RXK10319.1 DNA-binding response regulator [Halarcobacter bivalviorum]